MAEVIGPIAAVAHVRDGELQMPGWAHAPNAQLVFHRCVVTADGADLDEKPVLAWAEKSDLGQAGADELARNVVTRRDAALRSLAGVGLTVRELRFTPESAVVTGTADSGVRNVGITLHGTYGWPTLPASSLKGVTHAFGRDVDEMPEERRRALFGAPRPDERAGDVGASRGTVTFLDALPDRVRVVREVLTPHVRPYHDDTTRNTPPAEYFNPIPVEFLAVRGGTFVTALVGAADDVAAAERLLVAALDDLGVGAKTAAGYGYLQQVHRDRP